MLSCCFYWVLSVLFILTVIVFINELMEFLSRVAFEDNNILTDGLTSLCDGSSTDDEEDVPLSQASTITASQSSSSSTQLEEHKICCICLIAPPKVLFVPCGHYATCETCHQKQIAEYDERLVLFEEGDMEQPHRPERKCPICNTVYETTVKVDNICM